MGWGGGGVSGTMGQAGRGGGGRCTRRTAANLWNQIPAIKENYN